MKRIALAAALLLFAALALANAPIEFRDSGEETRFRALAAELRCVMCQNQSLADSSAPIAQDLRKQVLDLMREGLSDEQIKLFLVERYSEFVLYNPPVKPVTWALWFGPLLIVLAGAGVLWTIVRRRAAQAPAATANDNTDGQEW